MRAGRRRETRVEVADLRHEFPAHVVQGIAQALARLVQLEYDNLLNDLPLGNGFKPVQLPGEPSTAAEERVLYGRAATVKKCPLCGSLHRRYVYCSRACMKRAHKRMARAKLTRDCLRGKAS